MTTSDEAFRALAQVKRDLDAIFTAHAAAMRATEGTARKLTARGDAIRAEHARRTAAGVRVNVDPAGFDARYAELQKDAAAFHEAAGQRQQMYACGVVLVAQRAMLALAAATQALRDVEAQRTTDSAGSR